MSQNFATSHGILGGLAQGQAISVKPKEVPYQLNLLSNELDVLEANIRQMFETVGPVLKSNLDKDSAGMKPDEPSFTDVGEKIVVLKQRITGLAEQVRDVTSRLEI